MRVSGLIFAAASAFILLVALGVWQLQRREEKLGFIARHETALSAPAQAFPASASWAAIDFTKLEYYKVALEGRFLPLPEVHLYALLPKAPGKQGGAGWWIVLPFELKTGGVVFVNHGFVPQELKYPAQRPKSLAPPGEQKLEGLVRLPGQPGNFMPDSNPKTNEWYMRDPAAFAVYDSLESAQVAPVIVDQLTPNGDSLPQPSDGALHVTNNHLHYALTWFALALVLLIMTALFHFKRRKTGFQVEFSP